MTAVVPEVPPWRSFLAARIKFFIQNIPHLESHGESVNHRIPHSRQRGTPWRDRGCLPLTRHEARPRCLALGRACARACVSTRRVSRSQAATLSAVLDCQRRVAGDHAAPTRGGDTGTFCPWRLGPREEPGASQEPQPQPQPQPQPGESGPSLESRCSREKEGGAGGEQGAQWPRG